MAESRERTEAEREAARVERERRRSQAGAPEPEPPPAPAPEPEPASEHPPEPEPEPPLVEPAPPPFISEPDGDLDGDQPVHPDDGAEIASGTRRVGWRERTRAAAPHTPPPAKAKIPGRHRVRNRVLSVLALVLAAALIWFCVELFQPFHGSGHGRITVRIPPHSSSSQVGDLLEREGVVASGFFFDLRATLAGDRGKLMAGTYHLKLDMSYGAALKTLTTAPPAAKVTNVTIVPGRTRRQVDALLRSQGIRGSYLAATRRSPLLPLTAYGAPRKTPSLEGFLFPDTYQLRVPVTDGALVDDQLRAFKREFKGVDMRYAHAHHLSAYDVLIVASIVEKEAATTHDRPLVASVIYNRLKGGVPLGMDSTTRYEFNDYTKPLTSAQLNARSPYNTRLNRGLPPTPIGNPGLSAIRAAAHPAQTKYLYFVVKPCGNGASVFSSNYNQFLADSARYQSARTRRGGNSPANC